MYVPPHFAETRPEELQRVMREHPLGMLVSHGVDGLDAEHLPFEFDPQAGALGQLSAHVARANPLWQRCPTGTPVMVVFRGAQAYISPNGYPSKHQTHRQVPTWNYQVVHVHGSLSVHDDEPYLRGLVARLTRHHEATEPQPWKMGDAPPDYIREMLSQIVGIRVHIHALVGKSKLGQNKATADRLGAAAALQAQGQLDLADLMRAAGDPA